MNPTKPLYRSYLGRVYGSNDPTNSVKALKEVVVLRIRLQSYQVHIAMLQYYNIQYTAIHKIMLATLDIHPFNGLFSRTTWVSQHQKG